jgi:hypothetical protein
MRSFRWRVIEAGVSERYATRRAPTSASALVKPQPVYLVVTTHCLIYPPKSAQATDQYRHHGLRETHVRANKQGQGFSSSPGL